MSFFDRSHSKQSVYIRNEPASVRMVPNGSPEVGVSSVSCSFRPAYPCARASKSRSLIKCYASPDSTRPMACIIWPKGPLQNLVASYLYVVPGSELTSGAIRSNNSVLLGNLPAGSSIYCALHEFYHRSDTILYHQV